MAAKKGVGNGLILLGAILGIGLFAKKGYDATKLEWEFVGFVPSFNLQEMLRGKLNASIRVRFSNPTNSPQSFSNLFINIYNGVDNLGTARELQERTIPAFQNVVFVLPIELRLGKLASQAVSIVTTRKLPLLDFKGSFRAFGVDIPIAASYDSNQANPFKKK